jgi:hypothetical protein
MNIKNYIQGFVCLLIVLGAGSINARGGFGAGFGVGAVTGALVGAGVASRGYDDGYYGRRYYYNDSFDGRRYNDSGYGRVYYDEYYS